MKHGRNLASIVEVAAMNNRNRKMGHNAALELTHRMDRHFVPGLYINPESGQLEYDPMADVGIVVGTKTPYVEGLFMVDAAKEEYKRALRQDLAHIREVFD